MPHQGVVDRHVAVGVVLAHHVADDRGALAIGRAGRQAHLAHRVQDPAVDRLEPVAHVGQGARHDHAHRVIEVAHPHLVLDPDVPDIADVVGHSSGSPGRFKRRGPGLEHRGRPGRWPAAPVRRRIVPELDPDRLGPAGRQLDQGVAQDPRAMTVVRAGGPGCLTLDEGHHRVGIDQHERAKRPASAFWTFGSASPRSDPISPSPWTATSGARPARRSTNGSVAMVEPTSRRSHSRRRPGRAARARPSGSARAGSPGRTDGRGQSTVIQSLASPGSPSKELPGPLRIGRQEPVEEPEGEPARLEPRAHRTGGRRARGSRPAVLAGWPPESRGRRRR